MIPSAQVDTELRVQTMVAAMHAAPLDDKPQRLTEGGSLDPVSKALVDYLIVSTVLSVSFAT